MRLGLRKRQALWGYVFVSPWIAGTLVLLVWSLGRSLLLSFQQLTNIVNLQTEWAGLANYAEILREDVVFVPRLMRSMQDLALNLPLILIFSLVMALLVAHVQRGQTILRAIFFLPVVIGSSAVITQMRDAGATEMVLEDALGPIESALDPTSAPGQAIMGPIEAIVEQLTVIIWHTGVQILLFIAGLNSIPPRLYEAAEVDGATGWESFWKITLPMLSPVILVAAIYTIVDSFTDPLNSVVNYIMDTSIQVQLRLDYGAALGWVYFVVIFVLIALLLRLSSGLVFYMGGK